MASYPYIVFGCSCNPKCVCSLCGIKASICEYAGCQSCDKTKGNLGCQYSFSRK